MMNIKYISKKKVKKKNSKKNIKNIKRQIIRIEKRKFKMIFIYFCI